MKLENYLKRIAYEGPLRPNLETLTALHRAHLIAIPYEDLDVLLGRPVTIDVPAIYEKIVERRRGGWCYEMNGLFSWALVQIGFDVTRSAAGVMRATMGDANVGNHLVLKVEFEEGIWLADVGFGDGPIAPIRVTAGPFTSRGFPFALSEEDGGWWRLHNHPAGGATSFDFNLAPADEALLASKCAWLQSAPQSIFVQNAVVERHTEEGLWILRGRVLRHLMPPGEKLDRLVADAAEYVDILRQCFGLDLPEAATLWPRICARHEELLEQAIQDLAQKPAAAD